jgi:hypothetical protein
MVPCALIHYWYRSTSKVFQRREGLSWRRSASGLDQPKLNGVSIILIKIKNQTWNFIHLKIHKTKRAFLRSLYSLCLALNRLGIHPINISNQWWVRFGSCLNGTRIGPNHLSGYCSLVLFLQINGVRHRFLKRINSFDCMIDFPEKHWRACKRGALPTEL